jgi:hypothetical protein
VHEFSITPHVPSARPDAMDSDLILDSTVQWRFDPAFFSASEFPELAGGVKLTTRRAGETQIEMTAQTLRGETVRDEASVTIVQVDPNAWSIGEARYQGGPLARWGNFPLGPFGERRCGLPYEVKVPSTAACVSCHDNSDEISAEYMPTQTQGYSDYDLLTIVTSGAKLAASSSARICARCPMPDCVFAEFHAFALTPLEQQGLIARLRSVPPRAVE